MTDELKDYIENMGMPWWKLFYRMLWEQLPQMQGLKVLDFGSGLGITANHIAENNEVIAIDPNNELIQERIQENYYNQVNSDFEWLKKQKENTFDAIMCHNVLEYAEERREIFKELLRVLKPNGIISIVKHNHNGRIMQKIACENNLEQAFELLSGGESSAAYFGQIDYYKTEDILEWAGEYKVEIERVLGIRTFYALHKDNEVKFNQDWQDKMFEIEMMVSDIEDYKNIAFFNHVLLRKF